MWTVVENLCECSNLLFRDQKHNSTEFIFLDTQLKQENSQLSSWWCLFRHASYFAKSEYLYTELANDGLKAGNFESR